MGYLEQIVEEKHHNTCPILFETWHRWRVEPENVLLHIAPFALYLWPLDDAFMWAFWLIFCADLHSLFEKHPRMHLVKLMKWMSVQSWDIGQAQDSFVLLNFVWSLFTFTYFYFCYFIVLLTLMWKIVIIKNTGNCVYTSTTKSHRFWVYSYFLVWILITLGCQKHILYILYCHPAGCLWKPIITSCSNFWCLFFLWIIL